jgi:arabinofuranosyltransferase
MKLNTSGKFQLCLLAVLFLVQSLVFLSWIPDDAYVSFCYAEHLAAGKGLEFFPGERVEGFSNLLWTLFLAAGSWLGANTVDLAVISSLLLGLGSAFLIRWLMVTAGGLVADGRGSEQPGGRVDRLIRIGFSALPFVYFPLIFYASSGLEATAALFVFTLGALLYLQAVRQDRPSRFAGSMWCFFLLSVLRPEGILFLVVNAVFVWRHGGVRGRARLAWLLLPLTAFVLVSIWKTIYFGSPLPNTYHAKPGASLDYWQPIGRGLAYLLHFSIMSGLIGLAPLLLRGRSGTKAGRVRVYLGSLLLGQLLFIVWAGGDVLRFDRFSLPILSPLLALAWMGWLTVPGKKDPTRKMFPPWAVAAVIGIIGLLNLVRIPNALANYCYHDWMHANTQKEIGRLLDRTLPAGSTVVVNEVGAVAYYSKLPVIDMIGLTDATVSRILHKSYRKYGRGGSDWSVAEISAYLLGRRPACLVVPSYQPLAPWPDQANRMRMHLLWFRLFNDVNASGRYRRLGWIKIHDSKYMYFFILKDLEPLRPWPGPGDVNRCMHIMAEDVN